MVQQLLMKIEILQCVCVCQCVYHVLKLSLTLSLTLSLSLSLINACIATCVINMNHMIEQLVLLLAANVNSDSYYYY